MPIYNSGLEYPMLRHICTVFYITAELHHTLTKRVIIYMRQENKNEKIKKYLVEELTI